MVAPADRIGDLVVERALGAGSFASVWLVRHDVLRSRHALKLLDPELAGHPRLRERFLAEGRILAQLRHPNLVAVTGAVQDGEHVGLVMDLVDGPSLAARVASGPPLSPVDAVRVVRGIAEGLHHAHEAGIVHRDLKPENVLLADGPDGPRPVVVDFGIAKVLADASVDAGGAEPTRLHVRMGTPRYMSPEQVEASANVDRRTDVFALGVVLYELLLGRHAFDGANDTEVMFHVVRGLYPPPDELAPPLRAVVERALALKPDDRFPTCRALADALDALPPEALTVARPAGSPTLAPPTVAPVAAPTLPPPPPEAAAPGGPLLALIGGGLVLAAVVAAGLWATQAPAPSPAAPVTRPAPAAEISPPPPDPAPPVEVAPAPAPTPSVAAPAPKPRPKPAAPTPSDDELVKAAWTRHRAALAACDGARKEVLKVELKVAPGGEVAEVHVDSSRGDATVTRCAEKALKGLRFGQPRAEVHRIFSHVY